MVKVQMKQLFIKGQWSNESHGQNLVCQHEGLVQIVNIFLHYVNTSQIGEVKKNLRHFFTKFKIK